MRIPLSSPDITESEIAAVTSVLRTPVLSLGRKLEEFEGAVAGYLGAAYSVAASSGTAGLHLSIRSLGIGDGDEVIVPSFAFIAVANVLRYEGAVPVFVDIEPQMLNLDPEKIESAITGKTRAILVVHTFGCPAALAQIISIARRRNLLVIEDACEAIGAEYGGQKVGTLGDAGVYAFYPNKQITTGEGGMIVTGDRAMARRARQLRNQGRDLSRDWLDHTEIGYNYRLPELNCALGVEQMKRIEAILDRRSAIAAEYDQRLQKNPYVKRPPLNVPSRKISWFAYVIRLSDRLNQAQRDFVWREMTDRGIGCGRYFGPIHWQPAYSSALPPGMSLPVTEETAHRTLALPFFNRITSEQMDEVCESLLESLEGVTSQGSANRQFGSGDRSFQV